MAYKDDVTAKMALARLGELQEQQLIQSNLSAEDEDKLVAAASAADRSRVSPDSAGRSRPA
jgi:hypothetical protein